MRKNDITQLRSLGVEELTKKLAELRKNLEQVRTDVLFGRNKNVKLVQGLRKDIARVLTEMSKKGN